MSGYRLFLAEALNCFVRPHTRPTAGAFLLLNPRGEAREARQGLSVLLEEEQPELEPDGPRLEDVRLMIERARASYN